MFEVFEFARKVSSVDSQVRNAVMSFVMCNDRFRCFSLIVVSHFELSEYLDMKSVF